METEVMLNVGQTLLSDKNKIIHTLNHVQNTMENHIDLFKNVRQNTL